ncbi:MAG: bifunctional DNA primase/polymerase [Bacteroidales bacterium]|nr:bifunctional DNA primase/polymerase [Bacteroidales bacterium]
MNPIPSTPAGIPPRNPFDGLSVQASGAEPLPPGIYIATFVGVEVFTNDKVSDKFKWSWEVVAGQHKGRMATAMTDRRLTPFTHAGRLLGGLIGRPLIPCSAQNKRPLTTHGFKDASLDPARVTEWHARHPDCAWGTPTSAEYGVVDIDPRNGGIESWESLIRQHGPIPECPTVRTGGEGWHHVFQFPTGTRCGKIAQGVDLKAEGWYVIVPPSRVWEPHHSGPYRWIVRPWEVDAPPAPEWLLGSGKPVSGGKAPTLASNTVLGDADIRTHPGCRPLRDGGEGQRPTFLRLAGTALGQGHPPELVREWAEAWAERCDPPFGEWEKHYAGLVAKEKAKTEVGNNFLPPPPVVGPGSAGGGFSASNKQTTNSPYPNRDHPEGELVVCLQGSGNPSPNRVTPAGGMVEGEGNVVVRKPGVGFTCTPDPEADVPSGIRGHHSPDLDHCQAEVQLYTPGQVANSEETPQEEADMDTADDSFKLHPDAYHGPLGGVVKAVSPHTEADDPAVLACLLAAFGNAVGFGPHWHHGKPHGANLFVGLVGPTASRKETATGIAKAVITQADPEWEARVQHEGFDSGEGLIWAVRDAVGEDDPGLEDKRLLVVEEEWAKMFTLGAADKSILTPIIRQAFDRIGIGKPNKGTNAYRCRQPHISIIGNITPDDLRQSLTGKNAVAVANGFMNRFLLVGTRRTKFLPRGGRWREHAPTRSSR